MYNPAFFMRRSAGERSIFGRSVRIAFASARKMQEMADFVTKNDVAFLLECVEEIGPRISEVVLVRQSVRP